MSLVNMRARMLAKLGRPMTIRRQVSTTSATDGTVTGTTRAYRPEQIAGDVRQGDLIVAIGPTPAGWPAPPARRDKIVIDGRVWNIEGVEPLYVGATLAGYDLWARGG